MSLTKERRYFSGFSHVWTPVLGSSQLDKNPVPLTVAGEKLVFFRGETGPAALLDRCPLIATHWSRVMENALDAPHLPFVHRWTIGFAARAPADAGGRMETTMVSTDYGGEIQWSVDGATSGPNQGWIRYYAPNVMQLGFHENRDAIPTQLLAIVPVDEARTRSLSILAPGLSLFRVLNSLIGDRLSWEDRHVVETHDPPEVPRIGGEVSVRSDRATLAFRKHYDSTLRDSYALMPATPDTPSPSAHPI